MNRRGVTLIEILVSLFLLGVALMGMVGLFSFGFTVTRHSQDVGVAYSVARQEVEQAKNISFFLLPEAILVGGYDGLGNPTAEASPHFIATTTIQTLPDENGEFNSSCLRTVNVRVVAREGNEVVFESTTYLTRGGI